MPQPDQPDGRRQWLGVPRRSPPMSARHGCFCFWSFFGTRFPLRRMECSASTPSKNGVPSSSDLGRDSRSQVRLGVRFVRGLKMAGVWSRIFVWMARHVHLLQRRKADVSKQLRPSRNEAHELAYPRQRVKTRWHRLSRRGLWAPRTEVNPSIQGRTSSVERLLRMPTVKGKMENNNL